MRLYLATCLYLSVHFLAYVTVLRDLVPLRREVSIFLYHAASLVVLAAFLLLRSTGLELLIGSLCLHGIYSLSFLELWSLAQGGYSLTILRAVQAGAGDETVRLEEIGSQKKGNRLGSLTRLALVRRIDKRVALTRSGRLLACVLSRLVALAHLSDIG